jgi:hypothetical protein
VLKVGDMIELSEYGLKVTENKYFLKKVGVIQEIKGPTHFQFNYIIQWFGVSDHRLAISDHPKRDLILFLTNQKQ